MLKKIKNKPAKESKNVFIMGIYTSKRNFICKALGRCY